ncbi:MAG: hypothetical protein EOP10_01780 [Proteobacteria bacterium]|nr:MAG: hypothetical protein EOP10_01780 [Pseudomonadota bacterium]
MRLLAMLLLCSLANACGQATDENDSTSETQSVVLDATRSRWTNPSAIPVCIMNRAQISDEVFTDIKNYVVTEYANKTGLNFVGWGSCTNAQKTGKVIRVTFANKHNWATTGGMTAGGGLSMVGMTPSNCGTDCLGGTMRLDISTTGAFPSKESNYRDFTVTRTRATAIHEFGHAIGLMHEHERSDAEGCDRSDGSVVADDSRYTYVTDYDSNSIMNYCHSGSQTTLTKNDIAGVAYLYPTVSVGH